MKALDIYTAKRLALQEYRDKHTGIFAQAEALQIELSAAEAELKVEVKETGKSIENDTVAVIYQPRFTEGYDFKAIAKAAKPAELELIMDKAAVVDIDKKKFQALVKADQVSIDVERKAFRRTELSPAVLIKVKEDDNG